MKAKMSSREAHSQNAVSTKRIENPQTIALAEQLGRPATVDSLETGTIVKVLNPTMIGPETITEVVVRAERAPSTLVRATFLFHIAVPEEKIKAGAHVKLYIVQAFDGRNDYPTPKYYATQ
jgi:hypothetical protein